MCTTRPRLTKRKCLRPVNSRTSATTIPNSLTILNQPFSVRLDGATLRDLAHLHRDAPFEYASPITGSTLHGSLKTNGSGTVAGFHAQGVSFDASGPMRGPVPGRPGMSLNGRIHRGAGLLPHRGRAARDAYCHPHPVRGALQTPTTPIPCGLSIAARFEPPSVSRQSQPQPGETLSRRERLLRTAWARWYRS